MAETATKVPVKTVPGEKSEKAGTLMQKAREWHPLESLHHEIDRIFDDFDRNFGGRSLARSMFDFEPLWRTQTSWGTAPAVDIVERDKDYEITAELPGIDAANVDVKLANGMLTIRGEKKDSREDKTATSYVSERSYGMFERSFRLPDGTDADRIEASFKNGVLSVSVPKSTESLKKTRKIEIKSS